MTEKELRKLKRSDLMELLLMQSRAADEQKAELESLREQLESRRLQEQEAGSIAEAALRINHVFEAAQAAADQYLASFSNIEKKTKAMESKAQARCEEMERQARKRCEAMEAKAREAEEESRRVCLAREKSTQQRCQAMLEDAKAQSERQWADMKAKMDGYVTKYQELRSLFQDSLGAPRQSHEERSDVPVKA